MRALIGACMFIAMTASASAWWDGGHMQIAALAYDQLMPAIRARANALIRLNPDFATWAVSFPKDSDVDRLAFVKAATWADDIKEPAHGYTNDGNTPVGKDASRNTGYDDKLQHKYWHYLDIPFSPDGTPTKAPDAVNALTQITNFTATLNSTASDNVKSYDLVWLLHLVGDAHQPLHATSRFIASMTDGDAGGNSERVTPPGVQEEALHAYWDGLLGDRPTAADAIKMAASLPPPDPIRAINDDWRDWFRESFQVARSYVYTTEIGLGKGAFTLSADYDKTAHEIATRQAAVAGARLARLLNQNLK